jgi:phage shock protein PspC (stress-responsive transcriptional regulator)
MRSFWSKITSRKFLAAVVGVLTGLAMVFGLDQDIITTVSGAVVALASVIVYIATEGKIDAAAVGEAAKKVEDARDALTDKSGGEAV